MFVYTLPLDQGETIVQSMLSKHFVRLYLWASLLGIICFRKNIHSLKTYAPHIAEELYAQLGNSTSIVDAEWPELNEALLVENTKVYPVSINGKTRTQIELSLALNKEEVEKAALQNEIVLKWLDGNDPKKVIVVPGRIINIVL